jgi:hypothetical protein
VGDPLGVTTAGVGSSRRERFHVEEPNGRIRHRAEPVMFALALLVVPAIVLEETSTDALQSVAFVLNLVIWIGFAAELTSSSPPLSFSDDNAVE